MVDAIEDSIIEEERHQEMQKKVDLLALFLVQICGLTVDFFRIKPISMLTLLK